MGMAFTILNTRERKGIFKDAVIHYEADRRGL